jgi:hypothetical protein
MDTATIKTSPVIKSKFKQLQLTGQEAELYFIGNYRRIESFSSGTLEDARMFGDGYDFQIQVGDRYFLAEIKGLRSEYGSIRMTSHEYQQAQAFGDDYALIVVSELNDVPKLSVRFNPTERLVFTMQTINSEQITFHTTAMRWS